MSGAEVAVTAGKVLFSKPSYDFFFKWEHDKSLLAAFETQLNSTKALLNVAEANRMEVDSNVDKWYQKAQYAVLDAEDLLAIIHTDINMENYRLSEFPRTIDVIKEKFKYKGKDIVRSIHPYKSTRETEMREAIQKLQSLETQATHLGIGENEKLTKFRENRKSSSSDLDPSRIIGRSENEKEIVQMLNSRKGNDDPLRIISIIGMGGVGKSTLASMVYNRSEPSDQIYQLKGWVCVSDKFEIIHVIKSLLESITGNSKAIDNLEFLQKELKSALQSKKFLLVLDDVWNDVEHKWETLRNIFSVGAPGSRIIVTTREEKVVNIVTSPKFSYELNGLSDAESWSLFQSYAFEHGDSTAYPPSLEKIGKDLVGKCKGSPLALKMLGRLLLSKEYDEAEWNIVLHSKVWDSTNTILPSLWLSYYHLSMPVKQCFAYLSIFPKDHIYYMDKMVIFWVAEGLVEKPPQSSNGIYDYERVGRTYFNHLISNLFIQKNSGYGFVMHDLVHDLAEYVSKELLVNLTDIKIESRRLTSNPDQRDPSQLRSVSKVNRLHTFLPGEFSNYRKYMVSNELLLNFKYLRVLSLENCSISTVPTSIGDMKLLSFLNLSKTEIDYLPKWISRLYNLQFLRLSNCKRLERLPANLFDLVNLRQLIYDCRFKEMPDGIGRLTNLRTLSTYVLGKDKSKQLRDFRRLPNLQGRLTISGLNNVDDVNDVVTASFKNMEYLEELVLTWKTIQERREHLHERVLDAIQPHNNLKLLTIEGYGGKRLSNWIVKVSPSFTGIVSLNITSCYNLEVLPPLGDLRFLKDLKIRGLDSLVSVGVELYGDSDNPFPALKILEISYMKVMKIWSSPAVGRSGFSSLNNLRIEHCDELTEIPDCLPSLASLKISHCPKLNSLPSIGKLPFLYMVSIYGLDSLESLGEEFYGDVCNPFPALQILNICKMNVMRIWSAPAVGRSGFLSLSYLRIEHCDELTEIPDCFPSLASLKISHCPKLDSLPSIGNLQFLKEVTIDRLDSLGSLGEEFYGDVCNPFPALQILNICKMNVMRIWSAPAVGRSGFLSLSYLRIEHCDELTEIPDCFPSLASLKISHCPKLDSLPSIGNLQFLKEVTIDRLDSLGSLGEEFYGDVCNPFPALEYLRFSNMKSLKKWYSLGGDREGFVSLKTLEISSCPELTKIPYCFPSLTELKIWYCSNLIGLEMHDTVQKGSASSLRTYGHSLQSLVISNCLKLEEIPNVLVNLLTFRVSYCEKLLSVPRLLNVQIFQLVKVNPLLRVEAELQEVKNELCIRGRSINVTETSLDTRTGQFTALEGLDRDIPYPRISSKVDNDDEDIHELKYDDRVLMLPNSDIRISIYTHICNLHFLKELEFSGCHLPNSFMDAVLPSTLKRLRFQNCPSLITIPSQFLSGCKKHLEELELSSLNLARLPDVFSALESLQRLRLENCSLIKHFPTSSGLLFSSLSDLYVSSCLALKSLPKNIHDITTLRTLKIECCPNLKAPRDGFPSMMTHLTIRYCGKMEPVSKMKLSRLTSLIDLKLVGFPETSRLDDCIPDSIESLTLISFPRLESLSGVPSIIRQQRDICISNCPLLEQKKSWSTKLTGISRQLTSRAGPSAHARRETNLLMVNLLEDSNWSGGLDVFARTRT